MKEETKYKLLKDTPRLKAGEVRTLSFFRDEFNIPESWIEADYEWFQKVKEERIILRENAGSFAKYFFMKDGHPSRLSLTPDQIKAIEEVLNKKEEAKIDNTTKITGPESWIDISNQCPKVELFTREDTLEFLKFWINDYDPCNYGPSGMEKSFNRWLQQRKEGKE